jgi:hypothetical protein
MSKIIQNIFENSNLKENPMLEFFSHRPKPKAAGTYRGVFGLQQLQSVVRKIVAG